jgi:predicted GNAT family N-acyltransferase
MQIVSVEGSIPSGARELREAVFVREQGVPAALEWDGRDESAVHVVVTEGARTVGTARLRVVDGAAKVERVAVARTHRGRGIGRMLVRHVESEARARGLTRVVLHAQQSAVPFYAALDYREVGEPFDEAGIPHRAMERDLAPR